jgi:large subunit ribosomal protein L21
MYAVIETGGKQYRVKAGDLLVVDKLGGDVGSKVAFDRVLMLGDGASVSVGAPTVDGAVVEAALIETRKGDKIKVFKKIRRQGYRRTAGHRQWESVLRVTSVTGGGASDTWSGEVNLTPRAVLNARARGEKVVVAAPVEAKPAKAAPKPQAEATAPEAKAPEAEVEAKAATKTEAKAEPKAKAEAKPKAAPKAAAAKAADKSEDKAPAAKKPAAKTTKPKA